LPLDTLRFASPEEAEALALVRARAVRLHEIAEAGTGRRISGVVRDSGQGGLEYRPVLMLDADEQLRDAQCSCNFYRQNRLRRGPCAHMLALRQLVQPRLNDVRSAAAAGLEARHEG
jgi:hypothetical protein